MMLTKLVTEGPYYGLLLSQSFFVNLLLDKLGITIKKDLDKSNTYYINLALIFLATIISVIMLLINQALGQKLSIITLTVAFVWFMYIKFKYEPYIVAYKGSHTSLVKKIVLATVILTYLFVYKDEIKKVNAQIRRLDNSSVTENLAK